METITESKIIQNEISDRIVDLNFFSAWYEDAIHWNHTSKAQIKMWSPCHIAVMFRSTQYIIDVHASEYVMCGILIFLVNISGFET